MLYPRFHLDPASQSLAARVEYRQEDVSFATVPSGSADDSYSITLFTLQLEFLCSSHRLVAIWGYLPLILAERKGEAPMLTLDGSGQLIADLGSGVVAGAGYAAVEDRRLTMSLYDKGSTLHIVSDARPVVAYKVMANAIMQLAADGAFAGLIVRM